MLESCWSCMHSSVLQGGKIFCRLDETVHKSNFSCDHYDDIDGEE